MTVVLKEVTPKSVDKTFFKRVKTDFARNKIIYFIFLIPLAYYIIFHYIPMYGVIIAFKNYIPAMGIMESPWVGFKHFIRFFQNEYFWRLVKNTLTISIGSLMFGFPAPIVLALLINEIKSKKFVKVVQTATYLPHFVSLVVMCGIFKTLAGSNGIITQITQSMTGDSTSILLKPEMFAGIFVGTNIWQEVGWGSIIYLAALSGIDQSLYEACMIDGGGRLRQMWHVTLPGILPTIIILLILRMGSIMSVGYEKIILLYNDFTKSTADVISTYVYREGLLNANFSYSTAVGLFNSVINIAMLNIANRISRKVSETSLW